MGRHKKSSRFETIEKAVEAVVTSYRLKREEEGVRHYPYGILEKGDPERYVVKLTDDQQYYVFVANTDVTVRRVDQKRKLRVFKLAVVEKAIWGNKLPDFT